jgi:hypothetical protein
MLSLPAPKWDDKWSQRSTRWNDCRNAPKTHPVTIRCAQIGSLTSSGMRTEGLLLRQLPGEREGEGRASPLSAFHPEFSPRVLNDLTREEQPDAQTGRGSLVLASDPIELLEDVLLLCCGDADAEILDTDCQGLGGRGEMNDDVLGLG